MNRATSIRLDEVLLGQIDELATALDRPRTWIIEQAVRRYVEEQAWQVQAIKVALDDYQSGNSKLVAHEDVMREMEELEASIVAEIK